MITLNLYHVKKLFSSLCCRNSQGHVFHQISINNYNYGYGITYIMKLIEDGFFKRNKKIIIISFVIFILFALAGMIVSNMIVGDQVGKISKAMMEMPKNGTGANLDIGMSSLDLFIHNFSVSVIIIAGGILFSIISFLVTVFNAFSIGAPFGSDPVFALVSILPHSIFEYSATTLSLAVAFLITKLEIKMIRQRSFMGTLRESETELKDILVLIIVIVVLLAVAAVIEAYITPVIVKAYFGF